MGKHISQGEPGMHPVRRYSRPGIKKRSKNKCVHFRNGFCSLSNERCKQTMYCVDYREKEEEFEKEFENLPDLPFKKGDYIWHKQYGFGVIQDYESEYITFIFEVHGIKKLRLDEHNNLDYIAVLDKIIDPYPFVNDKVLWLFNHYKEDLMETLIKINDKILKENSAQWLLDKIEE